MNQEETREEERKHKEGKGEERSQGRTLDLRKRKETRGEKTRGDVKN